MMAISNFLNLIDKKELEIEEEQVVNLEELLQDVLSKHFVIWQGIDSEEEEEQLRKPEHSV